MVFPHKRMCCFSGCPWCQNWKCAPDWMLEVSFYVQAGLVLRKEGLKTEDFYCCIYGWFFNGKRKIVWVNCLLLLVLLSKCCRWSLWDSVVRLFPHCTVNTAGCSLLQSRPVRTGPHCFCRQLYVLLLLSCLWRRWMLVDFHRSWPVPILLYDTFLKLSGHTV